MSKRATKPERDRLRIGAAIADRLPAIASCQEVADKLGMSKWGVRKLECIALFKLHQALKQLAPKQDASESTNIGIPRRRVGAKY